MDTAGHFGDESVQIVSYTGIDHR